MLGKGRRTVTSIPSAATGRPHCVAGGALVAAGIPTVGITSSQAEETLRSVGCSLCVEDFSSEALFDAFGVLSKN